MSVLLELAAAVALGLLVGMEREHVKAERQVVAGIRTFALVSVGGYALAVLALRLDEPWTVAAGLLVVGSFAALVFALRFQSGQGGLTTSAALVATYAAGAMIHVVGLVEAAAVAVVTTILLLTKDRLHHLARRLTEREVFDALQVAAVLFVLLPLALAWEGELLDGIVTRGGPVDPAQVLLLVLLISVLSAIGYVLLRLASGRGPAIAGAAGGLVNSLAAIASLVRLQLKGRALAAGAGGATAAMLLRNLAIAALADPRLATAGQVAPFLVAGALTLLPWVVRRETGPAPTVPFPLALGPAASLGLLIVVIGLAGSVIQATVGDAGILLLSLGGLVSSGAVAAAVAGQAATGHIGASAATSVILLASLLGLATKAVLLMRASGRRSARVFLAPAAALLAGLAYEWFAA